MSDSLVVRKAPDGSLFVLWKAGPESTVRSIADLVGVTPEDIARLNPILKFRELESGDLLIAPLDRSLVSLSTAGTGYQRELWYEVQPGETIFSIARRTFDISIDYLMAINALTEVSLREGQALKIGWLNSPTQPLASSTTPIAPNSPNSWYYSGEPAEVATGADTLNTHNYATQKGVAWWNKSKPDGNFFALHRLAPLNSFIEITNPMFGRSVRAKVIGTIPPTYPEDISVIVSEGVARRLGAIDTRFYAELSYALD
jgi:LysM repeat protein